MIVVAIILILASISIPAIGGYIRNYTIRGAADQVAAEVQAARLQAVKKNVNFGAVFVVLSDSTYQYFLEDVPLSGIPQPYATSQQGPIRTLPTGVQFFAAPAPAPPVSGEGFRFNRLGAMCDPDAGDSLRCRDLTASAITPAPVANYVGFETSGDPALQGAVISLTQPTTGLTRTLVVTFGGRVRVLNR
jgi:hypothetical protein